MDPAEHKIAIDKGTDKRRYVLRGSIMTNGHKLNVLAYSLTQAAPSAASKKRPNNTRSKLVDVRDLLATKDIEEIFGEQGRRVVVGIDPGIKSTSTGCILDSMEMSRPKNITVTQGSHAFPTKKYLKGLEYAKEKQGINKLENMIEPIMCPQAEADHQGDSWSQLRQSIESHVRSVLLVQEPLRQFYSSPMFKVKSFHLQQAKTAITNKGIDRMIAATGCKGKPEDGSARPLFVVGDGEFGPRRGVALHQQFISILKKK
ncbi:hypothetical protein BGZ65_012886, partial [Modicella reniformis]